MGFILWILIGVFLGAVVIRLMPSSNGEGTAAAIAVGIAGGLIGGMIGTFSAGELSTAFDVRSLLMAIDGSLILLFCHRCFVANRPAV